MIIYGKQKDITDINLSIPGELITGDSHEINYDLLKGKIVIGLCGYAGSGKDGLGKPLIERLNFQRVSFGDAIKMLMDKHMKQQIYEDLKNRKIELSFEEINQLNPRTREIKEILRPYVIWFGKEMKKQNGKQYWINIAFENLKNVKKVVITDVRRPNELGIFEGSSEYYKRANSNCAEVGVPKDLDNTSVNERGYESLLLHINQRGLKDSDELTRETIRLAYENWLFDDVISIDSKIPDEKTFREKHVLKHVYKLIEKYPIYFV